MRPSRKPKKKTYSKVDHIPAREITEANPSYIGHHPPLTPSEFGRQSLRISLKRSLSERIKKQDRARVKKAINKAKTKK